MKDESAPADTTSVIDRVLSILNFALIIVIIFCFDTLYIDFLFR